MHQLDIFADSRDRVLLNNLADALVQGDRAASHAAIAALRSEFPDDRHLGPAILLINALDGEALAGDSPVADAAAALAARDPIDTLLHDAARLPCTSASAKVLSSTRSRLSAKMSS